METIKPKSIINGFKRELSAFKVPKRLRAAFFAGVIRGAGELRITRKGLSLALVHPNAEFTDKCATLAESMGLPAALTERQSESRLHPAPIYELIFPPESAAFLLKETGVIGSARTPETHLPQQYFTDTQEKQMFLRGLTLAAGTVTLPTRPPVNAADSDPLSEESERQRGYAGYLAELKLSDEEIAADVRDLLAGYGIPAKIRPRKGGGYTVYLQGGEALSDFMTALGAQEAMFRLHDFMAQRSLSNGINRRNNCDLANYEKSILTSQQQLDAIALLEARGMLDGLDEKLKTAAELRKTHPTASLSALSTAAVPAVSKSGLNHRLNKLVELAAQLQQ